MSTSSIIRIGLIKQRYTSLFIYTPSVISAAPGRAEIIGNHTDYNNGYALGAAIDKYTYAAVSKRKDKHICAFSQNFDTRINKFPLSDISKKKGTHWTNYLKAVTLELSKKKCLTKGFNIYIASDVPASGGVSSSAALELAVGLAISRLYKIKLSLLDLAIICQQAENGPLVASPCGFLDQATCALSEKNNLLFLDFLPKNKLPVSEAKTIPFDLKKHHLSFVIVVDKNVRRNLGQSGYPARRKSCEKSLPILSKLLHKKISSLRKISAQEFEKYKDKFNKIDKKMRMRIEHIIYENQRVLDSIKSIKKNDMQSFGNILTLSGLSALELFELDEKTPELTFLLKKARNIKGVLGVRNMGGGFSANILVLLKSSHLDSFSAKLSTMYMKKYYHRLDFISFQPSQGANILWQLE